jgi:hypothetical protein
MEFYMSTNQYLTLTILMPCNFLPTYLIQITSDALQIQNGTVYAYTSTVNNNNLQYVLQNNNSVQISGFSTVPAGSLITVTMRVWIDTNPIFNVYVSIDTLAHITNNLPIIYATTSATVSAIPTNFITAVTDSNN